MGGKTAPVQQQDHLPLLVQGLLNRRVERPADGSAGRAVIELVAQIDGMDRRQGSIFHSVGQL